jgi:general stress protein YciG
MESLPLRIYVYKITFLEVPYYYFGSHLEKKFNEYYMGSPVTNKDFWEFYTPMKEYVKFFEYTDDGYTEALNYENNLIRPVYNTDPHCLNEHCGGHISLAIRRQVAKKNQENKTAIFGRTPEEMSEHGKKAGRRSYELGVGVHNRTKEEMTEHGKRGGYKTYENGTGIFKRTKKEMSEQGKKNGLKHKENKTGVCGLTKEERIKIGKKTAQTNMEKGTAIFSLTPEELSKAGKEGGKKAAETNKKNGTALFSMTSEEKSEAGKKGGKATSSQRWQCTVTGFVSTPGNLTRYQRRREIDPANRIRIK